jgi:hypothetical protein
MDANGRELEIHRQAEFDETRLSFVANAKSPRLRTADSGLSTIIRGGLPFDKLTAPSRAEGKPPLPVNSLAFLAPWRLIFPYLRNA